MELFVANLPMDLTDKSLGNELVPFMNALGIVDWTCARNRNQPNGNITFLNVADGAKFLSRHGKIPRTVLQPSPKLCPGSRQSLQESLQQLSLHYQPSPQPTPAFHPPSKLPPLTQPPPDFVPRKRDFARLHILGRPIFVEKSRRPANRFILGHLKLERDSRSQRQAVRAPQPSTVKCTILEVACGKVVFSGPEAVPTFANQTSHRTQGYGRFGRSFFSVTFQDFSRMDISYDIIESGVVDQRTLTLVLVEPPRFYTPASGKKGQAKWTRLASLPSWPDHAKYVSHCLVYQLHMGPSHDDTIKALKSQQLFELTFQGLALNLHPSPYVHDYATSIKAFESRLGSAEVARLVPFPLLFMMETMVWNDYLHPSSAQKMLGLMERAGAELPRGLKDQFPLSAETLKQLLHDIPYAVPGVDVADLDPENLMEAASKMEAEKRLNDVLRAGVYGPSLPRHQTWVFKAIVTPTRITLHGPDAESKNRVLRMFPNHGDHFLRVSFMDENGQDLQFNPKILNHFIFERYRRVLRDGIRIAGRHYSFLGFSHSSLRSHSTWFIAPFLDADMQRQNYDSILKKLGDFSEIRIAAKCAARIGQAFSETPWAVDLVRTDIKHRSMPDVLSADGSRNFSDGVGTISWEAMEELWKALPTRTAAPTCFQIRWGGVKGMLGLDSRLSGKYICVREESMMKFPSDDRRELSICDVASRPLRLFLNRQVIKILEDMGTTDSWFTTLQSKALQMLRGVTATAANTSTFLRYQSIGRPLGLPSFINQLDRMGIDYRRDVFLRSVVEHVVLRELRLLKHKARIPVDKGVALYGIMDETAFLDEDEVYVTFDKTYARSGWRIDTSPENGPVIVTRSPALHPGDVRVVRMRTPPAGSPLLQLKNCIVFSQKGTRDLPSQLSGGDLDGDLFQVIWDLEALPTKMFLPADYPRVEPAKLDRPVKSDDIADFFIDFMRTDTLGFIAVRHQILADVCDEGTLDPRCIKLAEMHSTAVDFSKTGIPVDPQEMPKGPRTRPDFLAPAPPLKLYDLGQIAHIEDEDRNEDEEDGMGMMKHKYHPSAKILGRLYRGVDEKKIWNEDIHRTVKTSGPSVWDQLMGRVETELEALGLDLDYESYAEKGWQLRNLYEDSMEDSMWQFSDNNTKNGISEVEAFCGSLLNKRGSQTRQQRDLSIQLLEKTDRVMSWIVRLMRHGDKPSRDADAADDGADDGDDDDDDDGNDEGGVHLGGDSEDEDKSGANIVGNGESKVHSGSREEAVQRCWACLVVGCISESEKLHERSSKMMSFRVVAAACLMKELRALRNEARTAMSGGGYVGVSGDRFVGRVGMGERSKRSKQA
ncbi:hypothetical protein XA68_13165 [Ophiocordyceps unilateralis]|uniref:RNA-dependent RNA polymerase n=1 Tax=Ophiocordyceps unilateralis TaxID=268505 RepID=A0A2A9PD43_OPHUN|nr:hypothetical protein XA68_13165 [Ophiocordyceps unilateralis]